MQGDVIIYLPHGVPDFSTKPKRSALSCDSEGQTCGCSRLMFKIHLCNRISQQRSRGSRSLYQLPSVVQTVHSVKKKERHDGDADDILQKRKRDYFNLIRMKILFILNEIKQSSFPQDPGRTGETLVSFKGCYFSTFFLRNQGFLSFFLKWRFSFAMCSSVKSP